MGGEVAPGRRFDRGEHIAFDPRVGGHALGSRRQRIQRPVRLQEYRRRSDPLLHFPVIHLGEEVLTGGEVP